MSVDFFVAVPAVNWPAAAAVRQCVATHDYPVQVTRFPAFRAGEVVSEGASAIIDGRDVYLEGEVAAGSRSAADVNNLNDRLTTARSIERITVRDVLMSVRVRSPAEMRAASYVVSALIVCFGGFGLETQGNTSGRADFARNLIAGAEMLKMP